MGKESKEYNLPQLVVRSFVVTLKDPKELYEYYLKNGNLEGVGFLRFLLAEKDSSERGGSRLAFFGGRIKEEENLEEALQREIFEELGLTAIGKSSEKELRERLPKKGIRYLLEFGEYKYNYEDLVRRIRLNTFFVVPPNDNFVLGDPKIASVVQLSFDELRKLVSGGKIENLPSLEEHLNLNISSSEKFNISEEEQKRRFEVFKKALDHFEKLEKLFQRKFRSFFEKNPNITYKDFEKIYWGEFTRLMKKGFELTEKLRKFIKDNEEEKRRFSDFKERKFTDPTNCQILFEGLNGGFLGGDILYFMPFLIDKNVFNGVSLENLLLETTETTQVFFRYFSRLIGEFSNSFSEITRIKDLNLEEKTALISNFDRFVRERFIKDFDSNDGQIDTVIAYLREFWTNLENKIKLADSNLIAGIVQNYRLLNEVNNASLGKLILLFFGFDGYDYPKNNEEKDNEKNRLFKRQLRFEAGRQLLLFMKSLASIKYFLEMSSPNKMNKVNSAIESFFGSPSDLIEFSYKDSQGNEKKIIANVREKDGKNFIVDEKPPKDWLSFLRKGFREILWEIVDFSSYSIVYMGADKEIFIKKLINGEFEEELLNFVKQQFPGSVIKLERKVNFGLENFRQGSKKSSGKRFGSMASRIVAQKYILNIDDQKTEIVVYPYESTKTYKIDDNDYWLGWLEKRKDDEDYFLRRIFASKDGFPSFFELLFPPNIYPHLYKERLRAGYHQN